MLLKLVRMNKGRGPFICVKPVQVKVEVGQLIEIDSQHGYKLLADYPGMFEKIDKKAAEKMPPDTPVVEAKKMPVAPNKSAESVAEAKNK